MNFDYTIRIAQILMQYESVTVLSITSREVEAMINGFKVSISGEICVCHGGRLSIGVDALGYRRIEYSEYTTERPDGDAEMSYAIENDMLEAIESIFNFKYIVTSKTPWNTSENWNEPKYCSSFNHVLKIIEAFNKKQHWEDGTYELCGEKINGNKEHIVGHVLIPHNSEPITEIDLTFEGIKQYLTENVIEGLVIKDRKTGIMTKIRRKDYGLNW